MFSMAKVVVMAFLALLLSPILAQPQETPASATTGSLEGIVLDANGAPVAGAMVFAMPEANMSRQFPANTDIRGTFKLNGLRKGRFTFRRTRKAADILTTSSLFSACLERKSRTSSMSEPARSQPGLLFSWGKKRRT